MSGSHDQLSQFIKSDSSAILQQIGKEFTQKPQENVDTKRTEVITPTETQTEKTEEPQLIPVDELGNQVVQSLTQAREQQKQTVDALTESVKQSFNELLEPVRKGHEELQQKLKEMTGKVD